MDREYFGTYLVKRGKPSSCDYNRWMFGLLTLIGLLLSAPSFADNTYEIYYQSETESSIQLTVVEYGVKKKNAVPMACIHALQTLIFDGVQGSKRRFLPYVQDEKTACEEHQAFFNNFFGYGGYYQCIIAAAQVEKGKRKGKGKYYIVNVNIDLVTLKNSLVQHNVIRRFGV